MKRTTLTQLKVDWHKLPSLGVLRQIAATIAADQGAGAVPSSISAAISRLVGRTSTRRVCRRAIAAIRRTRRAYRSNTHRAAPDVRDIDQPKAQLAIRRRTNADEPA